MEIRKETGGSEDADPLEQNVWHPYYVDALILRDYDEDTDGTSVRHYYAQDANFNVTAVTDDAGSVVERYHYTPYGQLNVLDADFSADADGASDIANAVTFTGRRIDSESGLYYYRNRMYHAELGRFVTRDPIFYEGSKWNLYEAFESQSTTRMDPYGLLAEPPTPGDNASCKANCKAVLIAESIAISLALIFCLAKCPHHCLPLAPIQPLYQGCLIACTTHCMIAVGGLTIAIFAKFDLCKKKCDEKFPPGDQPIACSNQPVPAV